MQDGLTPLKGSMYGRDIRKALRQSKVAADLFVSRVPCSRCFKKGAKLSRSGPRGYGSKYCSIVPTWEKYENGKRLRVCLQCIEEPPATETPAQEQSKMRRFRRSRSFGDLSQLGEQKTKPYVSRVQWIIARCINVTCENAGGEPDSTLVSRPRRCLGTLV